MQLDTTQVRILRKIIGSMMIPSALISLKHNRIVFSNEEMIRRCGIALSDGLPFPVSSDFRAEYSIQALPLIFVNGGDRVCFKPSSSETADFELIFIDHDLAMLLVKSMVPLHEVSRRSSVSSVLPSFHFSYMESLSTGKRTCSEPEILHRLGLSKTHTWRMHIMEEDLPLYDNAVALARKSGGNHEIRYRLRISGGGIPVTDYFSVTQEEGKWPVLVGTIVSSNRSMEDVQVTERMMIQSRLLGGMVHDFKNLIAGIQNIIEWAVSVTTDEKVGEALSAAIPYTEQATQLITATLKLNSGKRDYSKIELLRFSDVIYEIEDILRRTLPSTIRLNLEFSPEEQPFYAQKETIKDILLNLCVNARDAMKRKGSELLICVSSEKVINAAGREQLISVLRIRDDGCGMSQVQLNTLFEAFYSTKNTGIGLGLWMVRETVKSFDGKINVTSEEGVGTTFEIQFPVPEADAFPLEKPVREQVIPINKKSRRKLAVQEEKTILLVEDEPLIRNSVAAWLESFGLHLLLAEDGDQALDIFRKEANHIDLILQDYIVPGIRGDELLCEFLARRSDIPIIVGSANPDEEMIASLKASGAFDFLAKPFRMEELLDKIENVFQMRNDCDS